jgi:DNA-directed RNA polymerase specialized sigma24 family protein
MPKKRCIGKALAERRRRATQLHLAGFTLEEVAEKIGVKRSLVSRDLQYSRSRSSGCAPSHTNPKRKRGK